MKRISTKVVTIFLILVFASLGILSGCSSSATSSILPTPATSTAPTVPVKSSTLAAPATTFELKFVDKFTSEQKDGEFDDIMAKLLMEKTGGKVKITMYHSESLGKETDFLTMMNGGIVDIINLTPGLAPASFGLELGLEMPMLGISDRQQRIDLTWELLNKGYFSGLDKFKVLGFSATPAMNIFPKKKINSLEDLQGMKIRASDATVRTFLEKVGASPVAMSSSDVYLALDRGVLDGTYTSYENFLQMKFYEVIKYAAWDPKVNFGCMFILLKKDVWNKMPADVQAGVNAAVTAFNEEYGRRTMETDKKGSADLSAKGVNVYSMNPTEEAKLKKLAIPLRNEWIAGQEAKGLPAKKMFDFIDQYLAKK
jgi:TRAP-type transport system periplasmic protein